MTVWKACAVSTVSIQSKFYINASHLHVYVKCCEKIWRFSLKDEIITYIVLKKKSLQHIWDLMVRFHLFYGEEHGTCVVVSTDKTLNR